MITVKRENKQIICGVYSIRNAVNNKRYVGSSIDIYGRWTTHIRQLENNKHDNEHLQKSWNKYGKNNFEFSILETCKEDDRFDVEQKWYDYYQVYDPEKGYNIAKIARCPDNDFTIDDIKNGKSVISYQQFLEIIDLLSNTNMPLTEVTKAVKTTKYMVANIYYKTIYKQILAEYNFMAREHHIENKLTHNEVIDIVKQLQDGIHPDDIAQNYCVQTRSIFEIYNHKQWVQYTQDIEFPPLQKRYKRKIPRPVTQYDLDGNVINVFENNSIAERQTGISCSAISQVSLGKTISAGGFIWRYGNDPFDKYKTKYNRDHIPSRTISTKVDQYKDGVFIKTYDSICQAKNETGANNIPKVLDGKYKQSGGFEWKRHVD